MGTKTSIIVILILLAAASNRGATGSRAPNYGAPFDQDMARAVMADLKAAGLGREK